jgi:hypothetical protein
MALESMKLLIEKTGQLELGWCVGFYSNVPALTIVTN